MRRGPQSLIYKKLIFTCKLQTTQSQSFICKKLIFTCKLHSDLLLTYIFVIKALIKFYEKQIDKFIQTYNTIVLNIRL